MAPFDASDLLIPQVIPSWASTWPPTPAMVKRTQSRAEGRGSRILRRMPQQQRHEQNGGYVERQESNGDRAQVRVQNLDGNALP